MRWAGRFILTVFLTETTTTFETISSSKHFSDATQITHKNALTFEPWDWRKSISSEHLLVLQLFLAETISSLSQECCSFNGVTAHCHLDK
jgi:hypothetical protein